MGANASSDPEGLEANWYTFPPAHLREADMELSVLVDG
jgi:hypothetical protein